MNKFEGIMNKALGYDSEEVKNPEQAETRRDIRERAKFPPQIQNILSEMGKLEGEESFLKNKINKIEENLENVDYVNLNKFKDELQVVEDRKEVIYIEIRDILSKDKDLAQKFKEYLSKKADIENPPEELKFSDN